MIIRIRVSNTAILRSLFLLVFLSTYPLIAKLSDFVYNATKYPGSLKLEDFHIRQGGPDRGSAAGVERPVRTAEGGPTKYDVKRFG